MAVTFQEASHSTFERSFMLLIFEKITGFEAEHFYASCLRLKRKTLGKKQNEHELAFKASGTFLNKSRHQETYE